MTMLNLFELIKSITCFLYVLSIYVTKLSEKVIVSFRDSIKLLSLVIRSRYLLLPGGNVVHPPMPPVVCFHSQVPTKPLSLGACVEFSLQVTTKSRKHKKIYLKVFLIISSSVEFRGLHLSSQWPHNVIPPLHGGAPGEAVAN